MGIEKISGPKPRRVEQSEPYQAPRKVSDEDGFREHLEKQAEQTLPKPLPAGKRRKPATTAERNKGPLKSSEGTKLDVDA